MENFIISIFKYLNQIKNYKITYTGTEEIIAYTYADIGGDINDKKSTSGHSILMGANPFCWNSIEQKSVATSTMEAEYISILFVAKMVLWIKNILLQLFSYEKPIKIYTDNQASKTGIENGQLNSKLKHINLKFYFNKDLIKNNLITLEIY